MKYRDLLLIDDDIEDQEIFISALENIPGGIRCVPMTDASVALQKLQAGELRPDVIFLDLNMPIMSGQEFLSKIKQVDELRSIPIVIFSTSASPETIAATKELGATNFITKPNSFNDLIKTLSSLFTNQISWA